MLRLILVRQKLKIKNRLTVLGLKTSSIVMLISTRQCLHEVYLTTYVLKQDRSSFP